MSTRSDRETQGKRDELLPGTLHLLILKTLALHGSLHGYEMVNSIRHSSDDVLQVEEGSLYPALQKILLKGWASAEWGISETNRKVRFYRLTAAGRKQLEAELEDYDRLTEAIKAVLRTA